MRDDRGFTLVEMLVAMAMFSILIIIAVTAAIQLSRASVTASSRSESSSAILNAFQLLDRQVRYADGINYAGVGTSGASYVEFRSPARPNPSDPSVTDPATCSQWRFLPSTGVLQSRSWNDVIGVTLPGWQTRATDVAGLAGSEYPFTVYPATVSGSAYQRLGLELEAGGAKSEDKTQIDTVFVARNSSISSPSNADSNGDGKSDVPVCNPTGYRP